MTDCKITGMFELPHKLELISEEKRPSLYSCSSLTNSICSNSTIDLDELVEIHSTIQDSDGYEKRESKPLQNNFLYENQIEPALNKRVNEVETPEPSIKPVKQSHPAFSKSMSMHDVSNILPLNLTAKSNTVSCETINSQSLSSTTKSKDSGFQRSLSCLSLTSGKRSYDHIQSKVKAYIKNIKESEALNKKNKLLKKQEKTSEPIVLINDSEDVVEKDDLIKEIQELKHELHEKSLYIDAQQRNYNKLLLKFAEARNIIDKLRVQSISYNYSDEDESKNKMSLLSSMNVDVFDYKLNRNISQLGSCIEEEEAPETTNEIVKGNFKPRSHSSPYEKSLSPVSKMFSSSSRLDKNYQPLANPKQSNPQLESQAQSTCKGEALANSCDGASRNGCFQLNNHSNLMPRQSISIDVPNDDPFDKVKKWQASLPSINLLGSYSSSDCEEPEHNPSRCPAYGNSKKSESNSLKCRFAKTMTNESEICNLLSQDLQNKCIITEMDVDTEPQVMTLKNNQDVTKTYKKEEQLNTCVTSKRTVGDKEDLSLYINNKISASTKHPKRQNKMNKPLNCIMRRKSVEVIFSSSEFEGKQTNLMPLYSRESSMSEGVSTHLPKSSSVSNCRINKLENDDSDDSSSISSSVLGSDSSPFMESPKRAKRRLVLGEDKISNKVPKITKSKSSQTTFILREPKLNVIPYFENSGSQLIPENKTTNYEETWLKHRNSTNNSMKTESSQRKAWNARNNTNFYVCKDFSFSKSTSLMECIKDMEGLVCKGAFVIRSVVDRNNTTC